MNTLVDPPLHEWRFENGQHVSAHLSDNQLVCVVDSKVAEYASPKFTSLRQAKAFCEAQHARVATLSDGSKKLYLNPRGLGGGKQELLQLSDKRLEEHVIDSLPAGTYTWVDVLTRDVPLDGGKKKCRVIQLHVSSYEYFAAVASAFFSGFGANDSYFLGEINPHQLQKELEEHIFATPKTAHEIYKAYARATAIELSCPIDGSISLLKFYESKVVIGTYRIVNKLFGRSDYSAPKIAASIENGSGFFSSLSPKMWRGTEVLASSKAEEVVKTFRQLAGGNIDFEAFRDQIGLNVFLRSAVNEQGEHMTNRQLLEDLIYFAEHYRPEFKGRQAVTSDTWNYIQNFCLALQNILPSSPPDGSWDSQQRVTLYMALGAGLLSGGAGLAAGLVAETAVATLSWAAVATGSAATTVFFTYVYPTAISQIPREIKPLKNLTQLVLQTDTELLIGRDEVIREIFACFQASAGKKTKQHPLLVGPAGVGKTSLMLEVARRIAGGQVPEAFKKVLKDKHVFGGSAAELLSSGQLFDSKDVIRNFLQAIGPHKQKVIVALDEVHALFEAANIGELAKSMLDTGPDGLPHFLGATTTEEYKKFIEPDAAIHRRFKPIFVGELSKEDTIRVVEKLGQGHPLIEVQPGVYEYLYLKTQALKARQSHRTQPEVSKQVLSRAIADVTLHRAGSRLYEQGQRLSREIESLTGSLPRTDLTRGEGGEKAKEILSKKNELALLNALMDSHKKKQEQISGYHSEEMKAFARLKTVAMLLKPLEEKKDTSKGTIQLKKEFLFLRYHKIPYLRERIAELKKTTVIPTLTTADIDRAVQTFVTVQ